MGVPARHYLPLAEALAARGVAVALHEWRGIGSSDRRAGRRCNWAYRDLLGADVPAGLAAARGRWPQAACSLGGHSLGGQLACLYASLHPQEFAGIALVASGAPYWRQFHRAGLIGAAYVLAPVLAALLGYLPGRRIGFGGNEARGVVADWARSGRSGRYAAAGLTVAGLHVDLEQALATQQRPVLALRLRDDWLGPKASLDWLLGKMPRAPRQLGVILSEDLSGQPADHFSWMKEPGSVAACIAEWIAVQKAAFTAPAQKHP
jgi:predicted alpha/beta hydrolase